MEEWNWRPFELLTSDVEWTIVGTSPLSKTYHSKQEFLDVVINPFNARMIKPLTPEVHSIYSDGDTVIILFDASATAIVSMVFVYQPLQ
jgi:ketosteroid isomerase-like protein